MRNAHIVGVICASSFAAACDGRTASPAQTTGPVGADAAPTGPTGALTVGQIVSDRRGFVSYVPGDAPLIVVASHGGTLAPAGVPDRRCGGCETVSDLNSLEVARAFVDSFSVRTGRRPHLIVNLLHRRKLDTNREIGEATGGYGALDTTWLWFQAAIDTARVRALASSPRALLIDLHGHGHPIPRLELGYLLDAPTLRRSDSALIGSNALQESSIAELTYMSPATETRGVAALRGAASLGGMLSAYGYRAVPSPAEPAPALGDAYFSGGYVTQRHGSHHRAGIDAIQIEMPYDGVRDNAASRGAFVSALTSSVRTFLARHYTWPPA